MAPFTSRHATALRSLCTRCGAGILFFLAAACTPRAPLPPPPHALNVELSEYAISHRKDAPRGRTVFRLRNQGQLAHDAYLVSLPEDSPPIGEILHPDRQPGPGLYSPVAFLAPIGSGAQGSFAYDLAVGRYALLCLVADSDGRTHAVKGMFSELRVTP